MSRSVRLAAYYGTGVVLALIFVFAITGALAQDQQQAPPVEGMWTLQDCVDTIKGQGKALLLSHRLLEQQGAVAIAQGQLITQQKDRIAELEEEVKALKAGK